MNPPGSLPVPGYESRDAAPWFVGLMGLCLLLIVGGAIAVSAWIYHARYVHTPTARQDRDERSFRHGAEWQSGIARDWSDEDRQVRENLTTYGWVDRPRGVTRIPIERAMTLIAQEARP